MAEIKMLVLCVAMVVVCLELEQGQAQGDVQFSVKHSIKLCGPANGCLPIIYHFGANLHRIKYSIPNHACEIISQVLLAN